MKCSNLFIIKTSLHIYNICYKNCSSLFDVIFFHIKIKLVEKTERNITIITPVVNFRPLHLVIFFFFFFIQRLQETPAEIEFVTATYIREITFTMRIDRIH